MRPSQTRTKKYPSAYTLRSTFSSSMIASFVRAMAPKDKRAVHSVETWRIVLACAGMVALTDWGTTMQARTTILLLLNVFVRTRWPSQYYPASQSAPGAHASPVTARCIAFAAEFHMYEIWAVWSGVAFWGDATRLWLVVLCGEVISTTGVLLQSELLLNVEDTIWGLHTCYMCYLGWGQPLPMLFFGGFGAHMMCVHLPGRFRLMFNAGRAVDTSANRTRARRPGLLHVAPLFTSSGTIARRACAFEEKLWTVPMLLGMPVITAVMYWQINARA